MASRPSPWRSLGLELYLTYNFENTSVYGGRICLILFHGAGLSA